MERAFLLTQNSRILQNGTTDEIQSTRWLYPYTAKSSTYKQDEDMSRQDIQKNSSGKGFRKYYLTTSFKKSMSMTTIQYGVFIKSLLQSCWSQLHKQCISIAPQGTRVLYEPSCEIPQGGNRF